ncbi:MAG TPA: UDP-glucose 4-epimerase GalE [Polyangiaceae bacterium]|nr:UDP-glucose 4-epimerase GalE [Polyangiaceae bacterium]
MNVVVTGGAGYIGSHMVRELLRAGHRVAIVDDLSTGHDDTVPDGVKLHRLNIHQYEEVRDVLRDHGAEAIFHFASRIQVGESVAAPRIYYRDNVIATLRLLDAALDAGVSRFVFSSSAAVYGNPERTPLDEDHPTRPVNPYGDTKLAVERILSAYEAPYGFKSVSLRYFNAAGADVADGLGERHDTETHLIPLLIQATLGQRGPVTLFGTDYPTPDGTCVRDYIHVRDLATAHLLALDYLNRGGETTRFNLGTGSGNSVREVVAAVERVSGKKVPTTFGPRRAGDPAVLVASAARAKSVLGWAPERSSIDGIIQDAWKFHASR